MTQTVQPNEALIDQIHHMDLFTLCDLIDDRSVDLILADLPYGTTSCHWDTVIPFAPMWERFKRVIKPRGAIVLTASQPFTSALVMSNPTWWHEELIWNKVLAVGFLDANRKHMKQHETVQVFCDGMPTYTPQMSKGDPYTRPTRKMTPIYGKFTELPGNNPTGDRYPKSILNISNADRTKTVHPTQKPVALFRYLIRTYTLPGELVLDPTCGSGTTALAAREEQRHYICGDSDAGYVEVARKRLEAPFTLPMFVQKG